MTKNRIMLAIIALSSLIVVVVFQTAVYAQNRPSGIPNQDTRTQNKDNRGAVRDLLGQGKETLVERIQLRGANILSRSGIRIDRLAKTTDKITAVAQKFADKGIDVGEAQNFIQSARDKVAQASSMQTEAQAILDGLTVDTLRTGASEFKAKMVDSYKALGESRKDLMSAMQALKTARASAKTATGN